MFLLCVIHTYLYCGVQGANIYLFVVEKVKNVFKRVVSIYYCFFVRIYLTQVLCTVNCSLLRMNKRDVFLATPIPSASPRL